MSCVTSVVGSDPACRRCRREVQVTIERWRGKERQAVIEVVRSADYAAFINHNMPAGDPGRERLRLILDGVAPALATLLPLVVSKGAGLPFGPASIELSRLTDSMLVEFGKVAQLQRLAELERYGLANCVWASPGVMRLEVLDDIAESMEREVLRWLSQETMMRVARMQPSPPDAKYVEDALDETSGVHEGWYIRYEGHDKLVQAYRHRALIEVAGCAEAEALPSDAVIDGRTFSQWCSVCAAALGRVFNHIAYATRLRSRFPELVLRNLLTVPVRKKDARAVLIESGVPAGFADRTLSHLTLDQRQLPHGRPIMKFRRRCSP